MNLTYIVLAVLALVAIFRDKIKLPSLTAKSTEQKLLEALEEYEKEHNLSLTISEKLKRIRGEQ